MKPKKRKRGRPPYPQWTVKGTWKQQLWQINPHYPDLTLTYRRTAVLEGDMAVRNLIRDAATSGACVKHRGIWVPIRLKDPLSVYLFCKDQMDIQEESGSIPVFTEADRDRYLTDDYRLVGGKWVRQTASERESISGI